MDEQTYNGWSNYPTWVVNMWLSNDEPLYRETCKRVGLAILEGDKDAGEHWQPEQARRYYVAEELRNWVADDMAPDLGATFAADLLGGALGGVDWYEIADAWIADCAPKDAATTREP